SCCLVISPHVRPAPPPATASPFLSTYQMARLTPSLSVDCGPSLRLKTKRQHDCLSIVPPKISVGAESGSVMLCGFTANVGRVGGQSSQARPAAQLTVQEPIGPISSSLGNTTKPQSRRLTPIPPRAERREDLVGTEVRAGDESHAATGPGGQWPSW